MMQPLCEKIERDLRKILPRQSSDKCDNLDDIVIFTEQLIAQAQNTNEDETTVYTHSVCHLFEHYGDLDDANYLNSQSLLSIAEKLVNVTLANALEKGKFSNVIRIIAPIIKYNLDNMRDNGDDFSFKPSILSDVKFIEAYTKEVNAHTKRYTISPELIKTYPKYYGSLCSNYSIEFCEAKNIKAFFREYSAKLSKDIKELQSDKYDEKKIGKQHSGIFVDVDGTLISRREINTNLHNYLIEQLDAGKKVTVFTGGDSANASNKLKEMGVDSRLLSVQHKADYVGTYLEMCIDDTTPATQGFIAKTYINPREFK